LLVRYPCRLARPGRARLGMTLKPLDVGRVVHSPWNPFPPEAGPPRRKRAPRVGISSTVFGVRGPREVWRGADLVARHVSHGLSADFV